ncbi:MAG: alpha,alpha-trehalase TreA [Cyclobacteriaceae bacterium]|jgi:alpha,alpha-trehalase|nr:alpha,alpha-trehalase TreA [Cyclobacteriaceae bacterium]
MEIHELGELFEVVQLQNILGDGKTFPDCIPTRSLEEIQQEFLNNKNSNGFDLSAFVDKNFTLPKEHATDYKSDPNKSAAQHIYALWDVLTRNPETENSSLIPLPHPYVVPGGRFREIYYWDSYFTMLGLQVSNRIDLIEHMVNNFAHLIDTIGYIPNGNRTYYLGRSQPPFFSLMVKLFCESKKNTLTKYLPQLEKEYQFWMKGVDQLSERTQAVHRVVRMPDGSILNRYWDENNTPRPEAYKEDVELAHQSDERPEEIYRHLRAAAESGWDFSSRWFRNGKSFATIHTTEIIPVDLNCLLYFLEQTLAEAFHQLGNSHQANTYSQHAENRKNAILKYCWNSKEKFFFDFDFKGNKQKESVTLAAAFPLFFKIATDQQASGIAEIIKARFLKSGGLTTTLINSGQQWDAPNGWAPLQWIACKGFLNYGLDELANEIKIHWTTTNLKVYANTGKMTEKYDVWNKDGEASGGEYPNQDGFGWTNGVFLAMTD